MTSRSSSSDRNVLVVGADANNLKFVDVEIPSPGVTLLAGASGSGKSSLLGDTLGVEAGRRNEAFLGLDGEDGDAVGAFIGPSPASLHIGQRAFRATVRTTVATATGLLARARRLFRQFGQPWAEPPGEITPLPTAETWASWLVTNRKGPIRVWAAPVRNQATDGTRAVALLKRHGVDEVVVRSETDTPARWEKGRVVATANFKPLAPTVKHTLEADLGGISVAGTRDFAKIATLLEKAFAAADGRVVIELPGEVDPVLQGPFGPRLDTTLHLLHGQCSTVFLRPSDHLLSFNAPEHAESGACRSCKGVGRAVGLDVERLVSHPERSMHGGAFSLWTEKNYKYVNIQHETIEGLSGLEGFDPNKPWRSLPESARRLILNGTTKLVIDVDPSTKKKMSSARAFEGFRPAIVRRVTGGAAKTVDRLSELVRETACEACGGTRWSPQARALRVGSLDLAALLETPLDELPGVLSGAHRVPLAARALVSAIADAARNLSAVGLGHLTASRGMTEVSSGEARRLRLAGALNAPLDGLLLLLDEPARGLHDEDVAKLAKAIRALSSSHTVVLSDHRHGLLAAVDHVVDMGTSGGPSGGSVVFAGDPANDTSLTRFEPLPRKPSPPPKAWLEVRGATINNLSDVDVRIPLGQLTCLTGLSGSGKSSFIRGALVPELSRALPKDRVETDDFDLRSGGRCSLKGENKIQALVALDQATPPPNRRSLVLTFLDVATAVRGAFAAAPAARRLGLGAADFGINSGSRRCTRCFGLGEIQIGIHRSPCPRCGGSRFGPGALAVIVDGRTIAALMDVPLNELLGTLPPFLVAHLGLLSAVCDLGLGHLTLGRRVDTLSGGETQRLRISRALADPTRNGVLFVLDEPAAGLHPVDVERLRAALERMLEGGRNTIVLVEHNPALIASSDHVVEFGPGSGPHGGRVVALGAPSAVAKTDTATGRVLKLHRSKLKALPLPPSVSSSSLSPDGAARARSWMRLLRGEDLEPPDPDEERQQLAVEAPRDGELRPLDVGDLDHELALFLLEISTPQAIGSEVTRLVRAWENAPSAELRVLPFLDEMHSWGERIPRSAEKPVREHLAALGLRLIPQSKSEVISSSRARGGSIVPTDSSRDALEGAVREALAIGAGYVELVLPPARVVDSITVRRFSLERGIVGPMRPAPEHLVRRSVAGACPVCSGTGSVLAFDEKHLVKKPALAPAAEGWLGPEATEVLRSAKRSELVPFIQRMEKEGLFDAKASYARLSDDDRTWLLHGYWRRPGPGSFLKTGKDPAEVGSWLRWDGLFPRLAAELSRSKHATWRAAVERSRSLARCPACDGTGLGETAELFGVGQKTLRQLVRTGTVKELLAAIKSAPTVDGGTAKRHEERRRRLLRCLEAAGNAPLGGLLSRGAARAVLEATVHAFSTLRVVGA